ncbi:MAG: hypothetical protein CMB31_06095 [Euryarchaeota archaeon]|nr:hypothetical protein [Euryarchaeota archaeon]
MLYYQSLKFLLGMQIKKIAPLTILFMLTSLVDLVGISLIGAYLAIIFDKSFIYQFKEYSYLNFLMTYEHSQLLLVVGISLIAMFIIKFTFLLFSNYLILSFAAKEQAKIQKLLVNGILHQSYENFLSSNSGDNLSSVANFSGTYREVLQAILQSLSNIIVISAVCIFLGITSLITLLALSLMIGLVIGSYNFIFANKIHSYGKDYTDGASDMIQGTTDVSSGLKEIKTLGKENFFTSLVSVSADKIARASLRLNFLGIIPRNLIEVVLIIFVVLVVAVNLETNEELSSLLSMLGVFMAGMIRIAPLISQLQISWNTIVYGKEPITTLSNIIKSQGNGMEEPKNLKSFSTKKHIPSEFKSLVLKNVSYRYPASDKRSIKNISFSITKGDFIGLIGPSGAGKTSLINIILGFLKPTSGKILSNEEDIHKDISIWREKCAYLPQDIFLVNGSLKKNITFEENAENSAILEKSIKLSKLSDFIDTLPEGIETNLGDKGVRLSGGQRQRVAIARAIFHERDLLLLDESTSALDAETEKEVMQELIGLRKEKTIIAIAHRISTLKDCNKIFRINNGELEGPLSYNEIARNN